MNWKHETLEYAGYEKVVYAEERDSGLKAIIAVHSTALGPACGGIRMLSYASRNEGTEDVLRLAKGMSYKSSLAGIGFGGGKSVLFGDPSRKTPELFQAMGTFIESFAGQYLGAKDMNVTSADLVEVQKTTRYVLGIEGVAGSSGDPSPVTATGVFRALQATLEETHGSKSLKGIKVAIQGIGYVGYRLAERIREEGGELCVTDLNQEILDLARRELKAKIVAPDAIYDVDCDIFAPCARGAILNPATIARLKCKAVVGCANNQLKDEACGYELQRRAILYAPDYAVNAGGIINIFYEVGTTYDLAKAHAKADEIYGTMKAIYRRAKADGVPPFLVADKLAEERIRAAH